MKTNWKQITLATILALTTLTPTWAEPEKTEPKKTVSKLSPSETNAMAEPEENTDPLAKAFEAFKKKRGFEYGQRDKRGRVFFRGTATVDVGATNSQWGKHRALAYDKALMAAQGAFLRDQYGENTVSFLMTMFGDESDSKDDFSDIPSDATERQKKIETMVDKAIALGDAKLNEKLRELGIDPEEFKAKPVKQKKVLFQEALRKTMMVKAAARIIGLAPIQTFEYTAKDGTTSIGVVMVYSPRLRDFAEDTYKGRMPMFRGTPTKGLEDIIPSKGSVLLDQFGLRIVFDKKGNPCIVSYGQWATNYRGKNSRMKSKSQERAKKMARAMADSYITLFQNMRLVYTEDAELEGLFEQRKVKMSDETVPTEEDVQELLDVYSERIKAKGTADMAGRGTRISRIVKHSNGHEIAVCVRVWTVENLQNTKDIRNHKRGQRPSETPTSSEQPEEGAEELRTSKEVSTEDF